MDKKISKHQLQYLNSRCTWQLNLGEEFILNFWGLRNIVVRFIKVTEKGYNFLNLSTNKCIFYPHFYPTKKSQENGKFQYFYPTKKSQENGKFQFLLHKDIKLVKLPIDNKNANTGS